MSTNARPSKATRQQDARIVAEMLRERRRRESEDQARRTRELLRDAEAGRGRGRFARGPAHTPVEPMS